MIEARTSSVIGTMYGSAPAKGDSAEAARFSRGRVGWDNAENALYCRFEYNRHSLYATNIAILR